MNEELINTNVLFDSMISDIDKSISKYEDFIKDKQQKLLDSKSLGFFDKRDLNNKIKYHQAKIVKFSELKIMIYEFRHYSGEKYDLPLNIRNSIERLGSYLSNEEIMSLSSVANKTISSINKESRDATKSKAEKVQLLLSNMDISGNEFQVYDGLQYKGLAQYKESISNILENKLKELRYEQFHISVSKDTSEKIDSSTEIMLSTVEEMIKNKTVDISNAKTKNIVDNFSYIKESYCEQSRIKSILICIPNTLSEFNNIQDERLTPIKNELLHMQNQYTKAIDKINKYLAKYDFSNIIEQIDRQKSEKNKNTEHSNNISIIKDLSFQIEMAKIESPNDYDLHHKLNEQLTEAITNSPLTKDEIDKARLEGQKQYHIEKEEHEKKVCNIKEAVEYEDQLEKDVMFELRNFAIAELERTGAFDEIHEYRNGDIHSASIDRESIIQEKISELKKIAEMTPEERGLQDYKKQGIVGSNATIEDLTYNQLNDIRIGYADNNYEFMKDYKDLQERNNVKPLANNIFKEYLKYRASLENKNEFLSFSDYAKQVHNIEQMSETMVTQELKDELEGMSR